MLEAPSTTPILVPADEIVPITPVPVVVPVEGAAGGGSFTRGRTSSAVYGTWRKEQYTSAVQALTRILSFVWKRQRFTTKSFDP